MTGRSIHPPTHLDVCMYLSIHPPTHPLLSKLTCDETACYMIFRANDWYVPPTHPPTFILLTYLSVHLNLSLTHAPTHPPTPQAR